MDDIVSTNELHGAQLLASRHSYLDTLTAAAYIRDSPLKMISNSLFFAAAAACLGVFVPLFSTTPTSCSSVDVHATTSEILRLLRLQRQVADEILEDDARVKESLMSQIQQVQREFWIYFGSEEDFERLIAHPVNVFLLYRHWTKSAGVWKAVANANVSDRVDELVDLLPRQEDTEDVALTLLRLQSMYNLTEGDIFDGNIRGRRSVRSLDKDCCFFLAKVAHASSARDAFRSWHDFCMKHEVQLDAERNIRAKDFDEKMKVLDLMLDFPDNPLLETLRKQLPIDMIEKLVEQNNKEKKEKNTAEKPGFFDLYNQLCQLQRPQSSLLPPEERCVLYTTHPTADALAPFKLEFHSYNPLVATVHDVISDRKIDELVSVASSRLETPKTISASDAAIHSRSGSRTGKVAFMQPREYKQVRAMAGKLTGLNLDLAEPLQLVAYGIGGQYEPHRDYFGSAAIRTPESGDRVATLLFYLNNVTEGGATVFPALGLAIHPQRGSALFWYNLFKNGEGDESTMHAGCPVLIGSKWIANQWFRERGQEFSRPCDLERDL